MHFRPLVVILLFLSIGAHAQVSQVRFEIPLGPNQTEGYQCASLHDKGLLLYNLFYAKENNAIQLIRLDTAFKELWRGFISVDRNFIIAASREYDNTVFFLLKDRFDPLADFTMLEVDSKNGEYTARNIKTAIAIAPSHFVVTKDVVLIGGYFAQRPLVLHFNYHTDQAKILPGFFNEVGELDQIHADDHGNVDIVVAGKGPLKKRSLWIRSYDREGELKKTVWLQPDDDKILIFGRTIPQENGSQIVCGVYGRYTEYSRGIFVANIDSDGNYAIKYYNYADLKRFFNYMRAKREQRVLNRIERRKIRGKKIRFNYRLLVNDLITNGDDVVMLGEAFYPHYSYPSSRYNSSAFSYNLQRSFASPYYRGDLVFDGYQYTHAVVIGFDKNGNLKWDNSFEINDVRSFNLEQNVKIHAGEEKISLLYLFDNVIRSKIIQDSDVLEGKTLDPINTGQTDDIVKERDTYNTKLEYWYGDVFYASGVQHVRKRRDGGKNIARRVFFINKIVYR